MRIRCVRRKAFTLVEIIVIVVICLVVAAMVFPQVSREIEHKFNVSLD